MAFVAGVLALNSFATVALASTDLSAIPEGPKALTISYGRDIGAKEAGYYPTYDFAMKNGTFLDKYTYYRIYEEDCFGVPVPMTAVYLKNGADDAGNNKTVLTPLSVSGVFNESYKETDRIHFSAYVKLLSGKLSYMTIMPGSIGAPVTVNASLKNVTSDEWTRLDMFYQPKVTYEYTVTRGGKTEDVTAFTTELLNKTTSPRVNTPSFWQAVLPACGQTYDASASYELKKITFGETDIYENGILQSSSSNYTTAQSSFYGFSDIRPMRITFAGSDASVGFSMAISNFSYGAVKDYDKNNVDFGNAYIKETELYDVNDNSRTISMETEIRPSDIQAPAGCTVAVYRSATLGSDMKYPRLSDDEVITEGNIVAVADEDNNLTYYNVVSGAVEAYNKWQSSVADVSDPCYRFKYKDVYGIGGKASDDASMLFDYDYTSEDAYTEYALGMTSDELRNYNGYIKAALNMYPTAKMSGIVFRIATNRSTMVSSTINISDLVTNRWNRLEFIIKVEGGKGSVTDTYINGECKSTVAGNYGAVIDGTLYNNFRLGFYVPKAHSANFAPVYFDDIHTYFSAKKPEVYSMPETTVCVVGESVSDVQARDGATRVLTSDLKLRASGDKILPTDIIVTENAYTEYDKIYSYGSPFNPELSVENAVDGTCYAGTAVKAVAHFGKDCRVYITEWDESGKEIGIATGINEAVYTPLAVGNKIKIIVADAFNNAPVSAPEILTVCEYTEHFDYSDLGDSVDFIPVKMRSYLNDTYDSCEKYADAKTEMDKPLGTTVTWECDIDNISAYIVNLSENSDMSDAYSYETKNNSYDFYNLKVGTRYWWNVTAITSSGDRITGKTCASFKTTDAAPRLLYIDGIVNARDLGGWKISDTVRVKQGMIIRTAKPNTTTSNLITQAGIDTMVNELGVKTEIDFRTDAHHPYGIPCVYPGVDYIRCPFAYANFDNKLAIIDIFAKLADEDNYPVNIHCLAGADRTGLITYLVNGVLGVSREDLLRDYMLTNFTNNGQWRPISGISNYIDLLDNYQGDTYQQKVYGYLVNEIGVKAEHLDSLIEIMTEDIPY